MEGDSQAKALRLRMYVLCSECARLIDLVEGNRQQRDFEGTDFIRHATEEHATWLEVLGIDEKRSAVETPCQHTNVALWKKRMRRCAPVSMQD